MQQHRFKDFWLEAEHVEWKGLWERGCFEKWKPSDLEPNDRVFGSRYHYKIKHNAVTGLITKFKVRLVVQGHKMQKGEDYEESFAPVPHSTISRVMMALRSFKLTRSLDEGVNGHVFVTPPPGCEEDEQGVVYECLRPLYRIPSSAKALFETLDNWFREKGFESVGFEDSVWSRPEGGRSGASITVSAHIDDCLIECEDLKVLEAFKADSLTRFDCTSDGEVEQYLGCTVVRDRANLTVTLKQSVYAERCATVRTPLEPGTRLTSKDSPQQVDPVLHCRYRGIVGHLSYLVALTRPVLAFAYSELSKFVQFPGPLTSRRQRERCSILWARTTSGSPIRILDTVLRRNVLEGWVDSYYASDPDTRRSVTGFVMSLNNGPVAWKAKRQSCVTLSSSEAEFVAASMCRQEVIYIRAILRDMGNVQMQATKVWEDNTSCILMAQNPVN
eukprot:3113161-Rhodomonas_salina.5